VALDTANKRASAIDVTIPWRGMLPFPDGTLDLGDKYQVGLMYRGFVTGGGGAATVPSHHYFMFTFGRGRSQPGSS
jgi:hypothetical protein